MLMKNTYQETFFQHVTAQIILKDKDDIDTLYPTNSSPKWILLPVSR